LRQRPLHVHARWASTGLIAEVQGLSVCRSIEISRRAPRRESTGKYVYLLKTSSTASTSTNSLILDSFQIGRADPSSFPVPSQNAASSWRPSRRGSIRKAMAAWLLNQDSGRTPSLLSIALHRAFDPSSGLPLIPDGGTNLLATNAARPLRRAPKAKFRSVILDRRLSSGPDPLSTTISRSSAPALMKYRGRYLYCGSRQLYDPTTLCLHQSLNTNPAS